MKNHLLLTFVVLLGGIFTVSAQTNQQLIDASIADFEKADKKMNVAYGQLLGILDDKGKTTLREAQRAWVGWRDAEAEFDSHHLAGGKLQPLEIWGSRTQTTEARTAKLLEDYKRFKNM